MTIDNTFNLITTSFQQVFARISILKIANELDWERHLYTNLKENLAVLNNKDIIVYLEAGAYKANDNILWIAPNKYEEKKALIDSHFNVEFDAGGHIKLNLNEPVKDLTPEIRKLLSAEKDRKYKVDIILFDKSLKRSTAYIELKFRGKLSSAGLLPDFYRLQRLDSVRNFDAIYIATGYDPYNQNILWMPLDNRFTYNFNFAQSDTPAQAKKKQPAAISSDVIFKSIKEETKNIYESLHATEAMWAGEIMYKLAQFLPANWRINSEVPVENMSRGKIDLGIYNSSGNMQYAIELKGHFEKPFPTEILNGLNADSNLQDDFIQKTKSFIQNCDIDSSVRKKRGQFPKTETGGYLNKDFFEKIIELYYQCKRLSSLMINGRISDAFMFYIDHNDDYSLRKKTHGFSEQDFMDNFKFRKWLIEQVLFINPSHKCKFIYMVKLNSKNDKKRVLYKKFNI